ncbi:MAG: hypothetical protein VB032_00980 [Burkholderiaceae bacterium]|nr:hypothetical protein [Burkholderiaceae bacterium]
MKLSHIAAIVLLGTTLTLPTFAQPGPGGGMGGGYRFDNSNTSGWTLMTETERNEHRQKMWNSKSYDECKGIQIDHHKLMEERAKAKSVTLRQPRYNACDRMKARGYFK